jgi:hypothetical protein
VWAVVLSRFGEGVPGFAEARLWYRRLGGKGIWARPFQKRFLHPATVQLFERAFEAAVAPWRQARNARGSAALGRHFPDIVAYDSSNVHLFDRLRKAFKGGRGSEAGLKICLAISAFGRLPLYARVAAGSASDNLLFPALDLFQRGTLWLIDKGFLAYERLGQIAAAQQSYVCPMRVNGNPLVVGCRDAPRRVVAALRRNPQGVYLRDLVPQNQRLTRAWDLDVVLVPGPGAEDRQAVLSRLVLIQGPRRQYPYLTNLPSAWSPKAVFELYRLRWQIELVFKELKQHLNLASMPSADPHAVQVFAWASLLALVVSRAVCAWAQPRRRGPGLAQPWRPALLSRALRGTLRLFVVCLRAPFRQALRLLRHFRWELLREARSTETHREDSFVRLEKLLVTQTFP